MTSRWKGFREGLFGALIMAISLITPFLNRHRRYWGATEEEIQRILPGDDLVTDLKGVYVHAITINTPAADIWPWLVQIRQSRGGFYIYELLENMVGCKKKNAYEIIPDLQRLEVGDNIVIHPNIGSPYKVATIEPDRALVLLLRVDMQTDATLDLTSKIPEKYQNSSWVLFLDERDDGTTRLISCSCNDWNDSLGNTIFLGIFGNFSIEMDRKMLLGIKERAETATKSANVV